MASSRPPPSTTTTTSSSAIIVQQLADLFRTNGHRILHGDSKVCFTSDSLTLLNNYFQSAKLDINLPDINGHPRTTSIPPLPQLPPVQHLRIDAKLKANLVFLHDFLQKIQVVKLIQNSQTLQGNVLLYPFQHVVCLELKKIPPHMVVGLSILRHQLETLICTHSVSKIEDLIGDCGGDSAQPQPWPRLKALFLDHNFIERIDQSLKYLTALEMLDLSHNRLQDCSKILELVPHVRRLNLSSNHLRLVPVWPQDKGPCSLLTLKMRQNSLEELTGIEVMKSIEELDLSDNFITFIPEQIRHLAVLKRVFFARNPFTYDPNYRQKIIQNLHFVFAQPGRELMIDEQPLTLREKQRIPRTRQRPLNTAQGFPIYSPPSSAQNTTCESATEPESVTTTSTGTVVSRRRSRRKFRDARLRTLDADETPTENATSGSDNESAIRRRLGKVVESQQEIDNNSPTSQLPTASDNTSSSEIYENDDSKFKRTTSIASGIPRKLANDLTQSPKRRKSPRSRKSDQPTKIVIEVVDVSNNVSDDTPVPDSPLSEKHLSFSQSHPTPMPVLEPKANQYDEPISCGIETSSFYLINESTTCLYSFSCSDSIRSIFFVTDQSSNDNRSFTIELDAMYLIEKDNNNEDYFEKMKYSNIKLEIDDQSHQNTVEFTFEKRRNEIERRVYLFDTIQDRQAFVEEIQRHLELPTTAEIKPDSPLFVECSKCGKTFPPLNSMHNFDTGSAPICLSCQNPSLNPPTELITGLQLNTTVDISSDEIDLDHRLHFQVATEHFTHNNEQIKFHFKCFVVRSTTNKHFIAKTILTDYGIYIFQYESSNSDGESEYILVAKDLLTNVLMLDIGYRLQTFTIELQSAAFAFLLADQQKTQTIVNHILEVLSPIVQSGEGALQKISRISSDEYRQRLFEIIKSECKIDEPNDDMIDFYSIIIRMDQAGNSQMIALLLLENWILMIEDAYATIDSRHVRLPAQPTSESNQQLKCDLMHLVNVTNYINNPKLFVFDFVDESETKEVRWKLEGLSNESKADFLTKVRNTYKKFMGVPMPETFEMV